MVEGVIVHGSPIDQAWAVLKAAEKPDLRNTLTQQPQQEPQQEPQEYSDPANFRQTSLTEFGLEMPEQEQEQPQFSGIEQLPGMARRASKGALYGLANTALDAMRRGRRESRQNTRDAMNINYQTTSPEKSSFMFGAGAS